MAGFACPERPRVSLCARAARGRSPTERKENHDMQINFAAFHAEYWVYALAGLVMIVVGTLLYTVDGPIKFSSWF
jgi:hypothetical protein